MKINPLSSSLIVLFLLSTACKGRGLKTITTDGEVVYTVEACSLNPVYEGCAEFLAESGALTPEICAVLGSCPQTPEEIIASIEQNYNTPRTIAPGDTVTLDGLYHASFGVSLTVDGLPVDIEPAESGEITFQAPASEVNKALGVTLTVSNTDYSVPSIYSLGSDSHPLFTGDAATQCTTQSFYNATGELVQGLKNCEEAGTQAAPECTEDGATGCITTDTFKAADVSAVTAADLISGKTLAGISGALSLPGDCSADGATGCITTDTFKAADTTSLAPKIVVGQSVAGVPGSHTPDFPDVGNVLSSDTVNSVSGTLTLPSASNVLTGSGAYGIAGTSETPSYTPDFPDAASVLDTDTTDGDTGTITTRGSWDLTLSFPGAGYYTGISNAPAASDLRRSVAVNGVTGDFPSSSSPLPRYSSASGASTATAGSDETDLTTFITQLTTDGTFEYWDSEGVRRTGSGDSDITNANVASAVDFENLSITGSAGSACTGDGQTACLTTSTYKSVDTTALTEWDLKSGKSAGGITGSVKTNCRNAANSAIYNYDGNTDSIPTSGITTGTTIDWWDTIDNYNNNLDTLPIAQPAGWSSDNLCGNELWSDVTGGDGCNATDDDCMMQDNVSGLIWSEGYPVTGVASADTTAQWNTAIDHCNDLTFGGSSDWRLPTQMELQQASMHGIRQLGYKGGTSNDGTDNNQNFIAVVDTSFWSASSKSNITGYAWRVNLNYGNTYNTNKTNSYRIICVRP